MPLDRSGRLVAADALARDTTLATLVMSGPFLTAESSTKFIDHSKSHIDMMMRECVERGQVSTSVMDELAALDTERTAPALMLPQLVDPTADVSHPDTIRQAIGYLRDVESFFMSFLRISLVPLHMLSLILVEEADQADAPVDVSKFFLNRTSVDPQTLIARNLCILGVKSYIS